MMRIIFASLLAFALAACSSSPEKTQALATAASIEPFSSYAAATLAPVGSFEWKAAPVYTKLAMLRHRAAKQLRAGEIGVQAAIDTQLAADSIRAMLDGAVRDDAQGRGVDAAKKLIAAGAHLLAVESALENARVQP